MNYVYPMDGKIHTRFSELERMTPGQVDTAMEIRMGVITSFKSEVMEFGTERHKMFQDETNRTMKLPECFYEIAGLKDVVIDAAERELVVEMAPGLVIHSRPDAYSISDASLFDFKTAVDGKRGWVANVNQYRYSKQGLFYAMILGFHGIEIKSVKYLCEIWNADHDTILGYDLVEQEVTAEKLDKVRDWTFDRLALLQVALEEAQHRYEGVLV